MKKVISICLVFFIALTMMMSAALAAPEYTGKINSKIAVLLMDADSGRELYSQNRDAQISPASTTKILTCLLAIENSSMTDVVTISKKAGSMKTGSILGIKNGEKIVMKDLLVGLMLVSGNDAAIAVAEHVSGSVDEFVALMNSKAQEIGMTSSNFTNPNGLHDDNLKSNVVDMAKLAQYAMKNPTFMEIVGTKEYKLPKTNKQPERKLENSNQLMDEKSKNYYSGVTGMKTGRTSNAGGCLVASATKDGMNLVCVVFNDHTPNRTDRWPAARSLFDYGFDNFMTIDVSPLLKSAAPVQTQVEGYALDDSASGLLVFKTPNVSSLYVTLDKTEAQALLDGTDSIEVVPVFDKEPPLKAPVEEGDIFGTVSYKSSSTGEILYSDNLIASRSVFEEGSQGGTAVVTLTPSPTKTIEDDHKKNETLTILIVVGISAALIVFLVIRMITVRRNKRFKKRRKPHYSYRIK